MYASPQYVRLAAAYHWRLLAPSARRRCRSSSGKTSNGVYRGWQLLCRTLARLLGPARSFRPPEPLAVESWAGLGCCIFSSRMWMWAPKTALSKVSDRARLQRWVWMALMVLLVVYNALYVYQIGWVKASLLHETRGVLGSECEISPPPSPPPPNPPGRLAKSAAAAARSAAVDAAARDAAAAAAAAAAVAAARARPSPATAPRLHHRRRHRRRRRRPRRAAPPGLRAIAARPRRTRRRRLRFTSTVPTTRTCLRARPCCR